MNRCRRCSPRCSSRRSLFHRSTRCRWTVEASTQGTLRRTQRRCSSACTNHRKDCTQAGTPNRSSFRRKLPSRMPARPGTWCTTSRRTRCCRCLRRRCRKGDNRSRIRFRTCGPHTLHDHDLEWHRHECTTRTRQHRFRDRRIRHRRGWACFRRILLNMNTLRTCSRCKRERLLRTPSRIRHNAWQQKCPCRSPPTDRPNS